MNHPESIEPRITFVQGRPVIMDVDLARLHHVPVRQLREIVQRRFENFPGDLCFQPDTADVPCEAGGEPPYAFTEQGTWMVAAVLNQGSALLLSIEISRAFDRFRHGARMHRPSPALRFV